jgi:hypothetical protein
MADTENGARRGVKFPIRIEAGGRNFTIQSMQTTELWYLFSEYEGLISTIGACAATTGIPKVDRSQARQMIDLMKTMCELCHEDGKSKVIFEQYFTPGDPTPMELTQKAAGALFGDFLAGSEGKDYQPLIMSLGAPWMRSISAE